MSDFRVPIRVTEVNPDYEQELDWSNEQKIWLLSERDMGFGKSWNQNINPSAENIESLLEFFRVNRDNVLPALLTRLSPGELTLIHQSSSRPITVYATLCNKCSQHWYVFRWETESECWGVYGRNCDFTWRRGQLPTIEEAEILEKLRKLSEMSPLRPPE